MFEYAKILDDWDLLPLVHVHYGPGEGGWAKQLDAQHVCIANVPMRDGLCLYDIVTLRGKGKGERWVDRTVQRRFTRKGLVRYPVPDTHEATRALFRQLWLAVQAAGGHLEGYIPGLGIVDSPAGADIAAALATTGIPGVTYEHNEEEDR